MISISGGGIDPVKEWELDQRIKELEAERARTPSTEVMVIMAKEIETLRSTIAALLERMELAIAASLIEGEWSAPQPDEVDSLHPTDGWTEHSAKARAAKRMAEIRKEMGIEKPQTCKWTPNPASDGDYYDAECGVFGMSLHVTNQARFCHGCGRPVEVVREEGEG